MTSRWVRTHCSRFDHGGCGLKILTENGQAVKVEPDPEDPFSKGYCCPKGLASLERIKNPNRLTHPLKRRGERGKGDWDPITWDDALDLLTRSFRNAMDRFGPEAVAFAQGAPKGLEFFMLLRLANLLNCPNMGAAQHVCHMPREQMATLTCGFFPVADLHSPTRCIIVWGGNPLDTNEEGVLGGHLMDSLKTNPSLIVVDPLRTELARRAQIWLQIRPGTDDVLSLGFMHILIEENLYDADFVREWTVGFDELKEAVRPYTPELVAQRTWVPKEKLVEAAHLYGRSKPSLIQWGNALEHSINSSHTCRSLVLLMALTGNLEVPGGNIRTQAPRTKRLGDLICMEQFPERAKKLLNRHFGIMPRLITVPNWILVRSILDQFPYPVKCLYTQGTNPLMSCADSEKVHAALGNLDFLAVADQVMTPTAAMADLVLPVATNLEFNDIGHVGLPHGFILARPKVVDPVGECWPDLKIINEWGKRMGFTEYFWDEPDQVLEEVLEPSGLTYEEFVGKGILWGKKNYYTYREKGFSTPSGKVELRSSLLEKWGYAPLPTAHEPASPDEHYPLILTSKKPKLFFHSAYRHLESLRKRDPRPQVRIHPDTARSLGIAEGDSVTISTESGSIVQHAHLIESVDPRVIIVDFGWWFPEKKDEYLFGWRESNINCLTRMDGPTDPIMGTNQMRAIPCRIEKSSSAAHTHS